MGRVLARLTRRVTLGQIRHIAPVPPARGGDLVDRVYRQVESDFGMLAPPVALHAPAPAMLAACWAMLRETTLAAGVATRIDKESVAARVSTANRCPYCVDIHGGTLAGLLRRQSGAGRRERPEEGADAAVRRAELAGVALTFEYLNRMVNVFLVDSPLPPLSGRAAAVARGGAARILARLAATPVAPGAALALLPPAVTVPPDLGWAAASPRVETATARAIAAVDATAAPVVPAPVRQLIADHLSGAAPRPPDTVTIGDWLDSALAPLPCRDRAAGRLALLTALASYRVSDPVVAEARDAGYDDGALVTLCGWASLAAARRAVPA
jgi:AhpD family alkylhydroperoxidase